MDYVEFYERFAEACYVIGVRDSDPIMLEQFFEEFQLSELSEYEEQLISYLGDHEFAEFVTGVLYLSPYYDFYITFAYYDLMIRESDSVELFVRLCAKHFFHEGLWIALGGAKFDIEVWWEMQKTILLRPEFKQQLELEANNTDKRHLYRQINFQTYAVAMLSSGNMTIEDFDTVYESMQLWVSKREQIIEESTGYVHEPFRDEFFDDIVLTIVRALMMRGL
jgi:hypothetical protein